MKQSRRLRCGHIANVNFADIVPFVSVALAMSAYSKNIRGRSDALGGGGRWQFQRSLPLRLGRDNMRGATAWLPLYAAVRGQARLTGAPEREIPDAVLQGRLAHLESPSEIVQSLLILDVEFRLF